MPTATKPGQGAGQDTAAEIGAVRALVLDAKTVDDCQVLRESVSSIAREEQGRSRTRTRAVAHLEAAAIHLARSGVQVPLATGCRLASCSLGYADAAMGEAPR